MYICLCKGITDSHVRYLGRAGVVSPKALAEELGIDRDDCCGRCVTRIADLAALARSERSKTSRMAPAGNFSRS